MGPLKIIIYVICCCVVLINTENQSPSEKHATLVAKTAQSLEIVDSTITNIVDAIGQMDVGSMFAKLSKGLTMLGPVFMAVSTILSIVSIFVPQAESPEMQALRKGFEKVNTRLDGLKSAISEIKLIAEISGAKSGLTRAFDAIDAMEVELLIARKRSSRQAWHYFIKRFEREYQHAADSIYLALSKSEWDADFRFDILEIFRQKFKCSPMALARVCFIGIHSISRGMAIEGGYLGAIKYPSRMRKRQKQWCRRLDTLRKRCGEMINKCEIQWEQHATKVFDDYFNENAHSQDPAKFAISLQQSLTMVAPNRNWGVFASGEHDYGPMSFKTTAESGHRWQVRVAENGKNVVVWHTQKEPPKISLSKFTTKFNEKTKSVRTDYACTWVNRGPLYYATSGHIFDLVSSGIPGTNLVVAKKSKGPHMAGPKNRVFMQEFPVTFCLTEAFVAYAFL